MRVLNVVDFCVCRLNCYVTTTTVSIFDVAKKFSKQHYYVCVCHLYVIHLLDIVWTVEIDPASSCANYRSSITYRGSADIVDQVSRLLSAHVPRYDEYTQAAAAENVRV